MTRAPHTSRRVLAVLAAGALSLGGLAACGDDDDSIGEDINEGLTDAGDSISDGLDDVGDSVEDGLDDEDDVAEVDVDVDVDDEDDDS